MSFMGFFPSDRERRLARDEAVEAIDKHGDQAETILLMKAQQSRSPERRTIYRLARQIVRGRGE
ncbi:hypothetical protein HZF05_13035 [Sphingomonas sp. CGMCC 1.13654]|uniref:Uncharacterized protein n=1 Tax=Sphingomonas chungangi TaxID=2683589 RepID=A0A838L6R3_9SPHN|nr:hypothetical protein [Sphingomonas chungangi]MBA2935021.1 hypothetical protein [Sphingomonas chungangi]MVW54136.1 hypothetical protein [Sphingomonas chungangi]